VTEALVEIEEPKRRKHRWNVRVLLVRFLMDVVFITVVLAIMPGFRTNLDLKLGSIALLSIIYGLLNAFIRPILDLFLIPFVVQTYGIVVIVVDIVIFALLVLFSGSLEASSAWQVLVGGMLLGVLRFSGIGFLGLTPPILAGRGGLHLRSTSLELMRFSSTAEERLRLFRVRQMLQIHGIDALFDGDGSIARFRRRLQT